MYIGDIYSGLDLNKCQELMKLPLLTAEECKSCWCFRLCDSCFVYGEGENGLDREARLAHCIYAKEIKGMAASLSFCFSLSWKISRFYTAVRLAGSLVPSVISILSYWIGKNILDMLSVASSSAGLLRPVLFFVFLLFVLSVFQACSRRIEQYVQTMHEELLTGKLSYYMMDLSSRIDLEYFDNPEYYDKLLSCSQDMTAISGLLWDLLNGIGSLFSVGISLCLLCGENLLYGILLLIAAVPSSVVGMKYTRRLYYLNLEQMNGERRKGYLQSIVMERRFAQNIRFYQCGSLLCERFSHLWKSLFDKRRDMNRRRAVCTACLECLPMLVELGISIDIILAIFAGMSTIGDYTFYTGLTSELSAGVTLFIYSIMQIYENKLKIDNLKTLSRFSGSIPDTGEKTLNCVNSIEFVNVCFTYPHTDKRILDGISFQIQSGEKVALVGLNGSGKSTLIKLLLRFYEPDEGTIYINGMDIREYSISALRRNFSVYFQEDPCFGFTLRENLTIADPDHPDCDSAAVEAFRASGSEGILRQSKKGLDTYLTRIFADDGIELSGGQYQRIALARTFFRRHTALILDEASSNLDPRAEHELFRELRAFTDGKTVLFTSHRLTNVTLADRIIVLEHGKIMEEGTRQALLKHGGRYAELYQYQQEHIDGFDDKKGDSL